MGQLPTDSCCILIIYNDSGAAEMLCMLLRMEDFTVEKALPGDEGFRKALEILPHVICIDVELNIEANSKFVRTLRTHDSLNGVYLFCTTGWGRSDLEDMGWAGIFDDVIVKPIDVSLLVTKIRDFCRA